MLIFYLHDKIICTVLKLIYHQSSSINIQIPLETVNCQFATLVQPHTSFLKKHQILLLE